jgi:hypothetical protein
MAASDRRWSLKVPPFGPSFDLGITNQSVRLNIALTIEIGKTVRVQQFGSFFPIFHIRTSSRDVNFLDLQSRYCSKRWGLGANVNYHHGVCVAVDWEESNTRKSKSMPRRRNIQPSNWCFRRRFNTSTLRCSPVLSFSECHWFFIKSLCG